MDFTFSDEQTTTVNIERDIVPAGVHTMTIRHAEEGPNQFKTSDENPQGMCLKLRLATNTGDYRFVFDDIPAHLGWRAKQLADALGVAASGATVSLDPATLEGRELTVEVSHYTSKAGKTSAVVKKYVKASGTPKPATQAKPRTQAAKVAAGASDDHIPF
jgi:hypothetical protein